MKKYITVLLVLFMNMSLYSQDKNSYYYYDGQKKFLDIDYTTISVSYIGTQNSNGLRSALSSQYNLKNEIKDQTRANVVSLGERQNLETSTSEVSLNKTASVAEYFDLMKVFQKEMNVLKASPTYLLEGKRTLLSNNFYVKVFSVDDLKILQSLASQYSIEILGYNQYLPLWFSLSCTQATPFNSIEAANIFYETGKFIATEPEFLYKNELNSNDPLWEIQWALKNTGQNGWTPGIDINVERAWEITTGSPDIKVALYDTGIDRNAPDFKNNIYGDGYDVLNSKPPSIQYRNTHGTRCAGIVAAEQNNNIGLSGVAPTSKLIPISDPFDQYVSSKQTADAISWAWENGADVISNSWQGGSSEVLLDAFKEAMTEGRGGKGTVVVFAAGNNNREGVSSPGNFHPLVIVVGGVDPCGKRKVVESCDFNKGDWEWGSSYGLQLDIMAPSTKTISTTFVGWGDKDHPDYINFGGTSAACPHVAGVVALMLSINPDLTVQEVGDIIEITARKIGPYSYSDAPNRPNGGWHKEMGYGLVDAYEAVKMARSYHCPKEVFITTPITTNQDLYANNSIVASSGISDNLVVNLGATAITLSNGFKFKAGASGRFLANDKVVPCSGGVDKVNTTRMAHEILNVSENIVQDKIELNKLAQNIPNPFSDYTRIGYTVSENVKSAYLIIHDTQGKIVKRIEIQKRGIGEVSLSAHSLSTGLYFYSLFTDGDRIDSKRFFIK